MVRQINSSEISSRIQSQLQSAGLGAHSGKIEEIARRNLGLEGSPLGEDEVARLLAEVKDSVVSQGSPIDFLEIHVEGVKKLLEKCLFKEMPGWIELWKWKHLTKAIFVEADPELQRQGKILIQTYLDTIFDQTAANPEKYDFTVQAIVNNLIAYYPYFAPEDGAELRIPQIKGDEVVMGAYRLTKITLTPDWMGSPMVAWGLDGVGVDPILIFKGTTFPTDEGACLSILSDFNPFASVGKYAFLLGRKNLLNWMEGKKVRITGLSLGGALALHTAASFPERTLETYTYNAPGIWGIDVKKGSAHSPVYSFHNDNDLVFLTGFNPIPGAKTFKAIDSSKGRSPLAAHARSYFIDKDHIIVKDKEQNSLKRKVFTLFHVLISIPIFIIGLAVWMVLRVIHWLRHRNAARPD